jgi:hypothetical protein
LANAPSGLANGITSTLDEAYGVTNGTTSVANAPFRVVDEANRMANGASSALDGASSVQIGTSCVTNIASRMADEPAGTRAASPLMPVFLHAYTFFIPLTASLLLLLFPVEMLFHGTTWVASWVFQQTKTSRES